jgi:hypothetical protein
MSARETFGPRTDPLSEAADDAERFRLLVQAVIDYAIYMLDPAGHVVSWNAGAPTDQGLCR